MIHTDHLTGRAFVTYLCAECKTEVNEDDTVWVNPLTGEATTGDGGQPYHVSCAPPEKLEEEFDDNQVYRRKILQLEQQIGDLGMQIGVLKKERADLWLDLSDLLASCMVGKPSDLVIKSAADTLTRIKIS